MLLLHQYLLVRIPESRSISSGRQTIRMHDQEVAILPLIVELLKFADGQAHDAVVGG